MGMSAGCGDIFSLLPFTRCYYPLPRIPLRVVWARTRFVARDPRDGTRWKVACGVLRKLRTIRVRGIRDSISAADLSDLSGTNRERIVPRRSRSLRFNDAESLTRVKIPVKRNTCTRTPSLFDTCFFRGIHRVSNERPMDKRALTTTRFREKIIIDRRAFRP